MGYQKYQFDRNLFNAALASKGMTQENLAKKLSLSRNSLLNRLKNNGAFNKEEIIKMYEIFGKKVVDAFLFSQHCEKMHN